MSEARRGATWTDKRCLADPAQVLAHDKRSLADPAQVLAHDKRSDEGRLFRAARRSPWPGMVARRTMAPRRVK